MERKINTSQIEEILGDLKNDPRVKKFIDYVENIYAQQSIDQILNEKAKKINVYEQSYALFLELIQTIKSESEGNLTSSSPNFHPQNILEKLKTESSAIVASIKNNQIRIKKLEKNNKNLDQFSYVVAHDLKAPLRGISNLVEWIEDDLKGKMDPSTEQHLKLLRSRVSRLENLIQGILMYAKAGKSTINNQQIDTKAFIGEIIELLHPPKNVHIAFEGNWPLLETDPIRFHQVFSNLIGNAIKYNNKPQINILIGCSRNEQTFEFYIQDNGNGIEAEYHQKIFHLFETLASSDKEEGSGIGLSIVKSIIDELDGKIRVESKINEGSKFIVQWPIKQFILSEKEKNNAKR